MQISQRKVGAAILRLALGFTIWLNFDFAKAQDGPSLDFTMSYIQEKISQSFIYFSSDRNTGSQVSLDGSGNIAIQF